MAGVEHILTFQLAGKLASSLPQAFSSAGGLVGGLSSKLSELEAEASQVGALVNHRKAVLKASAAYRQAKAKLDELESEMSRVGVPTKKMAVAHQKAKDAVERCSVKLEAEKQKLDRIPGASASAESSIVTLRKRQKELGDQIDVTRRKIEANAKGMQRFGAAAGKMTLGIGAFKGLGAAASSVKSAISGPVQASMKMEDAIADLAKVSDFTPEGLERMKRELERMSLTIPMSADGLAQIAAAAAGAGVAQKDLLGFTEQAAKMAVAFDMTAEQAGTMMSKWQSGMKLSLQETYALADSVNALSNDNAALANQIGDAIQRYGALGKVAGLSEKATAALSATLIASGATSETAATGMKSFMSTLATATQLSDRQKAALSFIGIDDPKQLEKGLQEDAEGTILKVLKGLKNLPVEEQMKYLKELFGDTGMESIGPLLQNIEALEKNFATIHDPAKYQGSMEKEFEARAKTTSNSLQLLKNSADFVARSFGDQFLDPIREGATYLGDLAFAAGEYVRNNKETVKTVLKVSAALGGMLAAAVAVKGVVYTLSAAMDVWRGVCALSTTAMKLTTAVGRGLAVTGRLLGGAFSFAGKALTGIAWGASRAAMIAWKIACVSAGVAAEATAVLVKGLGFAIQAAFTSPVGLAVMALAGLVAGGIALYKNFDEVKLKVNELWAAFSTKFPGIAGFVTTSIDYVQSKVEAVKSYFSNLTSWIGSTFFGTWGEAWSKVSAKFGEIFGGLGGLIKAPLNGVIGMVNGALSKLNALNIELPAMLGGGTIGFNIPEIPMLAEGGVVSSPTLAMIGEGSEPEAVMPLSTLPAISGAANNQPSVFNYSPVINVTGGADAYDAVKKATDESMREFERKFERMEADRRRLALA